MHIRRLIIAGIALSSLPALAQQPHLPTISAAAGTLVRWSAPGTTRCTMKGRSWAALQGTCYYPIDLEQPSASRISVSRSGSGHRTYARVTVEPLDYGTE